MSTSPDSEATAPDAVNTRIQELEACFNERMDRVGQRLEEIADFLGTASEMAIATQNKIDALGDKIDRMVELEHERDLKWDDSIVTIMPPASPAYIMRSTS